MSRLKIAIACQGGGSQTTFTAGALKALCEARIDNELEVVGISGTSGGAVCATLLWYAFVKGERPVWGRMMEFWKENTAQGRRLPQRTSKGEISANNRMDEKNQ